MEATLEAGFENFGVFVRLKASALNSVRTLSVILNAPENAEIDVPQSGPTVCSGPLVPKRTPAGCAKCQRIEPGLIGPNLAQNRHFALHLVGCLAVAGRFRSVPEAVIVKGVPV